MCVSLELRRSCYFANAALCSLGDIFCVNHLKHVCSFIHDHASHAKMLGVCGAVSVISKDLQETDVSET